MIRLTLLALILANLLAFSTWYGLLDPWLPGGSEPERIGQQVAADRLRVVNATQLPTSASAVAAAANAPGAAPAGSVPAPGATAAVTPADRAEALRADAPVAAGAASTAAALPAGVCLEAGPLEEARLERVGAWIRGLPDTVQARLERRVDAASFMVYVPPSASPADAQRRVEQLRQSRISDLFLINDGPLRLAISLGVFRSVEGARAHQAAMVARGIADAQIGPGPGAGKAERTWIRVTLGVTGGTPGAAELSASLAQATGLAPAACASPSG